MPSILICGMTTWSPRKSIPDSNSLLKNYLCGHPERSEGPARRTNMEKEWEQAIRRGDVDLVRRLVEQGAVIDSKDRHGQTALMIASMRGHTDVVRLLVENRAELNHTAKCHLSALMLAVINGHAEIVRILAEARADAEIRGTGAPGFYGMTALQLAEGMKRDEIVAILKNRPA
ncbi:MAG: ankyrin repeat domain-containing protein [Terriglobia bacterium]